MSKLPKYRPDRRKSVLDRTSVRLKSSVPTVETVISQVLFDDTQARIIELAKKFQSERLAIKGRS